MTLAADFLQLFLLGLLSSFSHCVGMCGGFVYCYASRSQDHSKKIGPHLFYNSGRIFTYGLLGALFAFLTRTTSEMTHFVEWQALLLGMAGVVMFLTGCEMLGIWHSSLSTFKLLQPLENIFIRFSQNQLRKKNSPLFFLGMILGGIPCGLVYTAGLKAAAATTPLIGFFDMIAFGLGTWPALIFIGWSSARINILRSIWFQRSAAVFVIVLSIATLAQAWMKFHEPNPYECHVQKIKMEQSR